MTDEQTILVRMPGTICEDCVDNSRHESEDFGIFWCGHSRYGGIYFTLTGMWQISGPFNTEDDFKRAIYRAQAAKLPKQFH